MGKTPRKPYLIAAVIFFWHGGYASGAVGYEKVRLCLLTFLKSYLSKTCLKSLFYFQTQKHTYQKNKIKKLQNETFSTNKTHNTFH